MNFGIVVGFWGILLLIFEVNEVLWDVFLDGIVGGKDWKEGFIIVFGGSGLGEEIDRFTLGWEICVGWGIDGLIIIELFCDFWFFVIVEVEEWGGGFCLVFEWSGL